MQGLSKFDGYKFRKNSASLFKHLDFSKSSAKILNAGFSFITYILLLRSLGTDLFSQLLVMYGLAGVFLWLTDVGLTRHYIYEFSRANFEKAKSIWGMRLISGFFTILIFGQIVLSFAGITAFFFASIALLDIFTDSFIEPRIISSKSRTSFGIQLSKRIGILLSMWFLLLLNVEVSPLTTFVIYTFVCCPIVLLEFAKNGTYRVKNLTMYDFRLSFGYWIQNAGTSLANLDIPLIAYFFGAEITVVISGIRKITTAIAMFGMTTSTLVFSESSGNFDYSLIRRKIWSVLGLTFTLSIAGIALQNLIFRYVLNIETSSRNIQLSVFLLLLTTMGVYLSNVNSILLGLKKIAQVTFATFLSSGVYLFSIFTFSTLDLEYFGIMAAILVNYLIEFILYRRYLKIFTKGVES